MGILNREQILEADDLKTEIVDVPEWGGDVCVSMMSGKRLYKYLYIVPEDRDNETQDKDRSIWARLCAYTIINPETKELLFTEEDIVELDEKSPGSLMRIFKVAKRLNGLGSDEIEELAKNSQETPDESSG